MNKKQQLVSELTERIEHAGITLPESEDGSCWVFRAKDTYWEEFPEGYCRRGVLGSKESLESNLACLSEETLVRILADDKIVEGMPFDQLWSSWGRAKYFVCEPRLVYIKETRIPTLFLRHDCFLHLFRGYTFQNSYDIVADGSNGSGGNHLNTVYGIINPPMYFDYDEDDPAVEEAAKASWKKEWAVFRKAMILSFPFQACWNIGAFERLLQEHPGLFDEFMNQTDKYGMRQGLDTTLGVRQIYEAAKSTAERLKGTPQTLLEIPMIMEESSGRTMMCGILKFSKRVVSFTWSVQDERKELALEMPLHETECVSPEDNDYPRSKYYYYYSWTSLALVLLRLSGVRFGYYASAVSKNNTNWDRAPVLFHRLEECATGLQSMWNLCYDYCAAVFG